MRIPRRSLLMLAAAGAGSALLTACGGGDDHNPPKNLVEVAQSLPDFSILVEAVVAADLATTLSGTGPFTVFAPTNAAFAALLTELGVTKEALLANKALLTAVLTYHVLPGKVEASAVPGVLGQPITTVQGDVFKIESNGGLKITDGRNRVATITATDVAASNGVIHVIDKVILPADKNIVQTALAAAPEFSLLVEAAVTAGLVDALSAAGPFTVFAPTNAAFTALLEELGITLEQALSSPEELALLLSYHVVSGRVFKAQVPLNTPITTLQGATFTVGSDLAITDQAGRKANIVATDVMTSNGVIHVIDKVILPLAP